jgi:hypothetical protein
MGKKVERLTARRVAGINKPGYYPDGAGLYLQVASSGSKSWIYLFSLHGRSREMGLGAVRSLSLAPRRGAEPTTPGGSGKRA